MSGKSSLVLLAGVMSGVALGLVCVTAALLWEGWSLRQQLLGSAVEAAQLRAQQASARDDLADQRAELAALTAEVKRLRQESAAAPEDGAAPADAQRAQIYLGNRMVGLGWVLPSPTGSGEGGVPGPAVASVMLDAPPADAANAAVPAVERSGGPRGPEGWYYQYWQSPGYWPYLYTSGWVEWPYCTNLTDTGSPLPFAPQTPPTSAPSPAWSASGAADAPPWTTVSRPAVGPSQVRARYPQPPTVATVTRPGAVVAPRIPSLPRVTPAAAAPTVRAPLPSNVRVRPAVGAPASVRATAVGTRR